MIRVNKDIIELVLIGKSIPTSAKDYDRLKKIGWSLFQEIPIQLSDKAMQSKRSVYVVCKH